MTLSGIADLAKLCVYLIPISITILMNLINRHQQTVILDTTYQTFIKHKLFCKHKLVKNNTIRVIPIILNFLLIYLEHLNKMSQFYTHLQTHPNPHIFTFQKPIRKNTKFKILAFPKLISSNKNIFYFYYYSYLEMLKLTQGQSRLALNVRNL